MSAGFVEVARMTQGEDDAGPVAYFDAGCSFCSKSADFAKARGAAATFQPGAPSDTMVLVVDGKRYERSDAALRLARSMRWPWSWLGAMGLLVPRRLRDWVYDQVAKRRHRLAR